MKDDTASWQRKPLNLTSEEQIQYHDFARDPLTARYAIWAYVEEDIPIPNELKPILLDILQETFKGKSTANTQRYWKRLVTEVAFLTVEEKELGMTQTKAIESVAKQYGENIETLTRRYNDGKYKRLRSAILNCLLQDAE